MNDSEILFARRIGFAVGLYHPSDWVRIRREHSPWEWAVQQEAQRIDPLWAERDDVRAGAFMTHLAQLLGSSNAEYIGDCVRNYLRINAPQAAKVLTPEEAAAAKGARTWQT